LRADLHTHTNLSCDANATIDGYIQTAIEKSIDIFGISEHIDYNKLDDGYGFYRPDLHLDMILTAKKMFQKGDILFGLEFSEPHLYTEELLSMRKEYPYDYLIGSIHWVQNMFPHPSGEMITIAKKRIGIKEFFHIYWNEVLQTVKTGHFEILAHIDFPKRYFHELWYEESIVLEIFKYIIDQEIALEINTSSLRKGLTEMMPCNDLLDLYIFAGGKYVTVGSDSHMDNDLGANIEDAKKIIKKYNLQEVIYINRKRVHVM